MQTGGFYRECDKCNAYNQEKVQCHISKVCTFIQLLIRLSNFCHKYTCYKYICHKGTFVINYICRKGTFVIN